MKTSTDNENLFKLIYIFRKVCPKNQWFFIAFFFFKYIGLIIISHNVKNLEDNVFTISGMLSSLTVFGRNYAKSGKGKTGVANNGLSFDYNIICLVIYAFILVTLLSFLFIFLKLKYSKQNLEGEVRIPRGLKVGMKIISWMLILICFFSQHLLEILFFSYENLIVINGSSVQASSTFNETYNDFFKNFNNTLTFGAIPYCIINTIAIVIINILLLLFVWIANYPTIQLQSGIQMCTAKVNMIVFLLLYNTQWLTSLFAIFSPEVKVVINLYATIISTCFMAFIFLIGAKKFNFYLNFLNLILLFLLSWCFVSGLLELIMYSTFTDQMNQKISIFKLIVELTNSVIICYCFIHFNRKYFLNIFTKNIFTDSRKVNMGSLYWFIFELKNCMSQSNNYLKLFTIIQKHKQDCSSMKECPCQKFDINRWVKAINQQDENSKYDEQDSLITFLVSFKDFIIVAEHEIVNSIMAIHKTRENMGILEQLFFLHVDFVYCIKQQYYLSLYYAQQYLTNSKYRLSFMTKLYFFDYKKQILKRNTEVKILPQERSKSKLKEKKPSSHKLASWKRFFHYTIFLEKLQKLMLVNTENYENIITFRNLQVKNANTIISKYSTTEEFIEYCEKLNYYHMKFLKTLRKHFVIENLKHTETCYLLFQFFSLFSKEIPVDMKGHFLEIDSYALMTSFTSAYEDKKMSNPVILSLAVNDTFAITYISQKLCDHLNYTKSELINTDFHKLLPITIARYHQIEMKKFVLLEQVKLSKETFFLDSDLNMVPVTASCRSLPTYEHTLNLIINIAILEQKSENIITYNILLDSNFKIMAMSRIFEEQFFFSLKMFEILKINFCVFFALNQEKFMTHIEKEMTASHTTHLEEENRALSILSNIETSSMFALRDVNRMKTMARDSRKLVQKSQLIRKREMIEHLDRIKKAIDDQGLDMEWYTRLNYLKLRLSFVNASKTENKDCFAVTYTLKNIGDIYYSIAKVLEEVDANEIRACPQIMESLETIGKLVSLRNVNISMKSQGQLDSVFKSKMKEDMEKDIILDLDNKKKAGVMDNGALSTNTRMMLLSLNHVVAANYNSLNPNADTSTRRMIPANDGSLSTSKFNLLANSSLKNLPGMNLPKNFTSYIPNLNDRLTFNDISTGYFNRHRNAKQINAAYIKEQKVICVILFIFLFAVIFLSIFIFNLKSSILELSTDMFYINAYTVLLKSDIYYSASGALTCCMLADNLELDRVDNFDTSLVNCKWRLTFRGSETIDHYNILLSHLNKLANEPSITAVFELFNQLDYYKILNSDWSYKERYSSLTDEIGSLHFYLLFMDQPGKFQKCRLRKFFFNGMFNRSKFIHEENSDANFEEKALYYIFFNVITKFREKMEALTTITSQALKKYHESCKNLLIFYNSFLLLCAIIFYLAIFKLISSYKNKIKDILIQFYSKKKDDDTFEDSLHKFQTIVKSLDEKTCLLYEDYRLKLSKKSEEVKDLSPVNASRAEKTKQSHIDQSQSMNIIQSIQQMNNASRHLLSLKMIENSKYIIGTAIVLFILIGIGDIFLHINTYDNLIFANEISINFLDRVPKLCELLLYAKISVILNNTNYLTTPFSEYANKSYSNHYNISFDLSKDSLYDSLSTSEFSLLYYQFQQTQGNIQLFKDGNANKQMLRLTRQWEQMFNNNKEDFCIYQALGFAYYSPRPIVNFTGSFMDISDIIKECKKIGQGINLDKLQPVLSLLAQQLILKYSDFAKVPATRSIEEFFMNMDFIRVSMDTQYTMKRLHNTMSYLILNDMKSQYKESINMEFTFSLIGLFFNIGFIFYIMIMLLFKLEYYHRLLENARKLFMKAMRNS